LQAVSPIKGSTQVGSTLACKYKTILVVTDVGKHSILLRYRVHYSFREFNGAAPDVRIRETSEPLAGAMTFSITTFIIMTFNIIAHSITKLCTAIKSNIWLHSIRLLTGLQILDYIESD
jgi:hypothetical protein